MKEVIIKVEGMMCGGCENRIQNAVTEISGIESVIASHEEGTVKIVLNSDIDINIIKETIEDLGFSCVE